MSAETTQTPELDRLRAAIERVDRALVRLLADRVALAREIGALKQSRRLPTLDPAQEAAVIRRAAETARAHALPVEAVRDLFWQVVALTRNAELES